MIIEKSSRLKTSIRVDSTQLFRRTEFKRKAVAFWRVSHLAPLATLLATMTTISATTAAAQQNMENIPPPKNNLVPESELQSAVKAMKEHLDEWKNQPTKTTTLDSDTRSVLVRLLEQAEASLTAHLVRLVETVGDREYHSLVNPQPEMDLNDTDDSDDDHEDSDDEFDEQELMDQEALQRARELRHQVRESAERVSLLRSRVTDRTVALGQREVALLLGPPNRDPDAPYDPQFIATELSQPFQGQKNKHLLEMEHSLNRLSAALKDMDVDLPDKIESLQKTVETIQEALRQGTSLSQTEKAIRSRDNEGPAISDSVDDDVAPEKRLASFLAQY